jgi:transcriptional regulator
MYIPAAFRLDDRAALLAHAAANPFATVVTSGPGGIGVSHLPLLVGGDGKLLRGHVARDNPQLQGFAAGVDALAIFHGPHGYVSPSVYLEPQGVPTWNYVVVHARGRARVVDEAHLRDILSDSVAYFDTTGWRPPEDEALLASKLSAIAGFEIEIADIEGKWKLSQNRSLEDQGRVIDWLERGDDASRALARVMRGRLGSLP